MPSTSKRVEYKYLVPNALLPRLRSMIAPFVVADTHNRGSRGYTVRSIYFDTPSLRCYHEKQAGLRVRTKIRVRGYNERRESNIVFLETKQKCGAPIVKNRAPVTYEHVGEMFASGDVERYVLPCGDHIGAVKNARRFLFHVFGDSLRPAILVIYEREAYQSRFDDLRITLDKNVRSSIRFATDALFEEDDTACPIAGHFILELKFVCGLPAWVKFALGRLGLSRQALSKYGLCTDQHVSSNGSRRRSVLALSHVWHT